ncbi:MAG: OadG family protein [Treponema sp.]|jgi:sodium pump decarboxylase gamma subunit|nr:OadG family protein [Treponema sp.]
MTILEMLEQSAIVTVLGMTVVFVFLWIMILCINAAGKLIHRVGLDEDIRQKPKQETPKSSSEAIPLVPPEIAAAVMEYRKKE